MAKDFFNSWNSKTRKLVFFLSLFVALYWITGQFINIYRFAIADAIFEILWFPLVALTVVLPIYSLVFWAKEKFILRSVYLVSLLLVIATILTVVLFYK